MKHLVILMGMPGSGKDTQSALLEKSEAYKIIRVGVEVRKQAEQDAHLQAELNSGHLADEEVIDGIVKNVLVHSDANAHLLSDGYPRSFSQASALQKMCEELGVRLEKVLFLELPKEEVYRRLTLRAREDDKPEILEERLEVFAKQTQPVLDYYQANGLLVKVNGAGSVEEVHARIVKALQL